STRTAPVPAACSASWNCFDRSMEYGSSSHSKDVTGAGNCAACTASGAGAAQPPAAAAPTADNAASGLPNGRSSGRDQTKSTTAAAICSLVKQKRNDRPG